MEKIVKLHTYFHTFIYLFLFLVKLHTKSYLNTILLLDFCFLPNFSGCGNWSILWGTRLFQVRMEHYGWHPGYSVAVRHYHFCDIWSYIKNFRYPPSLQTCSSLEAFTSDKSGSRIKAGGPNITFIAQAYRKYCAHLLHIFHHFWNSGGAGTSIIFSLFVLVYYYYVLYYVIRLFFRNI